MSALATSMQSPAERDRTAVIEDRRQIAALLGRVLHARSLLSLGLGEGELCSSLLLEVSPLRGCLLIDAPFPEIPLAPGTQLLVSGQLDGGRFVFRSTVEAPTLASSSDLLQLRFPERVQYRERRGAFRITLPANAGLPASQFTHDGMVFRGMLADLSRGGAATVVTGGRGAPGEELECLLRLPGTTLQARAEVRSRHERSGQLRLGLRLVDLTPAQDAMLSAEIAALQRMVLRGRRPH
jgi:c-di-GMP-binding flagellar brake protein YcgR